MSGSGDESDPTWLYDNASDVESDASTSVEGYEPFDSWNCIFHTLADEGDREDIGARLFEDVVDSWDRQEPSVGNHRDDSPSRVHLPRLDPDEFQANGSFRADVDSVKGLIHLFELADVFHPSPTPIFGMYEPPGRNAVKVTLGTALSKCPEHMRGLGFSNRSRRARAGASVSIPRVPNLRNVPGNDDGFQDTWCFPPPGNIEHQSWKSLADFPHFLLGEAYGSEMQALNLWCVCFGAEEVASHSSTCKQGAQRVFHFVKAQARGALSALITRHDRTSDPGMGSSNAPGDVVGAERRVYDALRRWCRDDRSLAPFMKELYVYFVNWQIFERPTEFSSPRDRFVTIPPVLDIICKLFVYTIHDPRLTLTDQERKALSKCMVYLDGKGWKDQICTTTSEGLDGERSPLVRSVNRFVPSLKRVSRGLCRIDIGYEWHVRRHAGGCANLWSVGCFRRLLAKMPSKWRNRTRMYSTLGLAEAVDLQAHMQFWIPPPPHVGYDAGPVPPTNAACLPLGIGLRYMDSVVPRSAIEEYIAGFGQPDEGLFDGVSVVNIYCPGPRKLCSSFGKAWALDLEPIGPIAALVADLGEAVGLRKEMRKGLERTRTLARGFLDHIEVELPAQSTWTLRAEIGADTIQSAVHVLDFFASSLNLNEIPPNERGVGMHAVQVCERPIAISVDTVTSYMVKCIKMWLSKLEDACAMSPLDERGALLCICSEQSIKTMTFLVRGQNPWIGTVSRILLHGGILRDGLLLPHVVDSLFESIDEGRVSAYLGQVRSSFVSQGGLPRKGPFQKLARVFEASSGMKHALAHALRDRRRRFEERCPQLVFRLLMVFYGDVWDYLVAKHHWSRDGPVPSFLCGDLDCTYDVDSATTKLRDPHYNALTDNPSVVHPSTGLGRRTIHNSEFLNRWFPLSREEDATNRATDYGDHTKWFLSTRIVWDVVCTALSATEMKTLRDNFEKAVVDARLLPVEREAFRSRARPISLLVPDGRGPNRPFNTLNRWQVVVGQYPPPFVPPSGGIPQTVNNQARQVTRDVLNKEYMIFKSHSRRGFTDHELNVFSMFMLLEGAEDRLNHVDQANRFRCNMAHVEAFVDPGKALLYCFRVRRTVQQITDKFNAACRARGRGTLDWSLREALRRIHACLGLEAIGRDGRLNKTAARQWLHANRKRTLDAYRGGFEHGMGPILDDTNLSVWLEHQGTPWTHPIPRELCPIGGEAQDSPSLISYRNGHESMPCDIPPMPTPSTPNQDDSVVDCMPLEEIARLARRRRLEREHSRGRRNGTAESLTDVPRALNRPPIEPVCEGSPERTQGRIASPCPSQTTSSSFYARRSGFES